jgi:hypothetical protein
MRDRATSTNTMPANSNDKLTSYVPDCAILNLSVRGESFAGLRKQTYRRFPSSFVGVYQRQHYDCLSPDMRPQGSFRLNRRDAGGFEPQTASLSKQEVFAVPDEIVPSNSNPRQLSAIDRCAIARDHMNTPTEAEFLEILEQADDRQMQYIISLVQYAQMAINEYGDTERATKEIQEYYEFLLERPAVDDIIDDIEPKSPMTPPPESCVYIIGCGGQPEMFKIGKANNIKRRFDQIATSNPFKPYIVHVFYTADPYSLEAELHRQFAAKRTHGEWFQLSDEDVINAIDAGESMLIGGAL